MSNKNVSVTVNGVPITSVGFLNFVQGSNVTLTVAENLTTDYTTVTIAAAAGSAASGGTPALTLSTSNSAGAASTFLRTDDTIAAFDATAPTTQAFGDAAAAGSAGVAARRDHKHAMPSAPHTTHQRYISFSKSGTLSTSTGAFRWYNDTGATLTFTSVRASAGTAPASQSILCDVNVDGTTIWSSQGNRVAVAAAANTGTSSTFNTTTIADGHYITVDVDQVGSGTTGSDLIVTVWMTG